MKNHTPPPTLEWMFHLRLTGRQFKWLLGVLLAGGGFAAYLH